MTRTSLIALTVFLMSGGAYAQTPSESAGGAVIAHPASGPDGTVGALQTVVRSLATSPDDVAAQQEGRSTAAGGGVPLENRPATEAAGASPGTVGATPGSDMPR